MDPQEQNEIVPIGKLCNMINISTRTLRYWEEMKIIESIERQDRSNRGYTPYMVRRIKFIIKLKQLGLTIKEMQRLYQIYGDAKKTDDLIPELVKMLDQQIDRADDKIAEFTSLRKEVVEYRRWILSKSE